MNRKARRAAQKRDGGMPFRAAAPQPIAAGPAARALISRGNVHLGQGEFDQAINCYLRAIELQPEQMDAHNNLAAVLLAQGRFDAVAQHFEQILEVRPDYIQGYDTLVLALLGSGEAPRALQVVLRALATAETPENRSLFVACLRNVPSIPDSDEMRSLLIRAMSEPWGRPDELVRHFVSLIRSDDEIAAGIAHAAAAWPSRLPADRLFGQTGLASACSNQALRCLLENARIDDIAVECYVASAREALLDTAAAATVETAVDDNLLAFHCAIARQCFINEYIYTWLDRERATFDALRSRLVAALVAGAPVPPLWLAAIAAYAPLHTLQETDRLLGRDWPDSIGALLRQQVAEPAEERRLSDSIPCLTPIESGVSTWVQEQYEENPYPRWIKAAAVGRVSHIDARLLGQFPFSRFRKLERTGAIDVLVAGCGTGQQLVDVARRIVGARVVAVDLSRASLCYAKRQTAALGLANIEFGQADILHMGALDRTFDVIDCGGVLHHLGDPEAGWRVLVSRLRPDGVMRIGLYSELARRHVAAARAFVADRGYGSTADDIRRFRQDVLALPSDDPIRLVALSPDFFSLSACRDLVFHVQEHCFTLPRIKAFLTENDLEFLGFEIDPAVLRHYGSRFQADRARTDLDGWHNYEQAYPGTFAGMYQFWLQHRG